MNKIIDMDINNIICRDFPWKSLQNSSILVTGANGMIPSYFVYTFLNLNKLQGLNITVFALVRNREKALLKFNKFIDNPNFKLIVQDVSKPLQITENLDYIIHGASQASPKYYNVDPVGTINANVIGTSNLLELGYKKAIKDFLFLSTGEVYGIPNKNEPISENDYGYTDILNIRSCYGESKRLAETMCVSWCHQFKVSTKIARIYHTYGPGLLLDDGRVFADFIKNIVENKDIVLHSDGKAKRPFCYITDCISAMFSILFFGKTGQAYNIANMNEYLSMVDLAQLLVSLYPEKMLTVKTNIQRDVNHYMPSKIMNAEPDISKILALGWNPSISATEGFSRTINYFLHNC